LAAEYARPTLLGGERFGSTGGLPAKAIRLPLALPNAALRRELWTEYLADSPHQVPDLMELASRFRLNAGQIRDAAAWAAGRARGRGQAAITMADLENAVAFVVMPTLDGLARSLPPRHTWDELILPADVTAHLHEFAAAIRRREQVYDTWGFDRRRPMGRGLNALFAGPSGTGKTMAAEIIAGELGLSIFKIDLSAVVSKYIGETEKHLRRLFAEAEQANAILFFDEADALFGKRSEVRDAHDRYANIEVAYLLQALEEHAGVTILATNLFGNLDDAFVRRVHYIVHFPFPDEDMRRRIWGVIFPAEAPLAPDVDRADLARRFRITGGHIRNIALGGAFLAADDGETICMDHLLRAARREFQKMGKIIEEADFAPSPG
jgi:SpoVK/Ycf46/Vps4 family AAA+-type ATPase